MKNGLRLPWCGLIVANIYYIPHDHGWHLALDLLVAFYGLHYITQKEKKTA
jgi:hypothetical protein